MFKLKKIYIFLTILSFEINCSKDLILNSFKTNIKINKDRSVDIKEDYIFTFYLNKHGITRTFPVDYYKSMSNQYKVDFKLNSVLRDDKPEKYTLKKYNNSKIITIGDPNKLISGKHSYRIDYKVNKILGAFNYSNNKEYDELYFQAIPKDHNFDIENAIIKVRLPKNIKKEDLKFKGYFGTRNPKSINYVVNLKDNVIKFKLTKPVPAGEKFSIVVGWPSGYIDRLTDWLRIRYFLEDNIYILILILGLIVLIIYYFIKIKKTKSKIKKGTIIPLFSPPKGFTPSAVGFIYNYKFNNKLLTAEIVNMAVNNLIKINYKKSFLKNNYTLIKNQDTKEKPLDIHKELLAIFFQKKDSLELNIKNSDIIEKAIKKLDSYLDTNYDNKYLDYHLNVNLTACVLSFIFIFISAYFNTTIITLIAILVYIFFIALFSNLIKGYTQEGQKILEEITGFRQFLSVTESEKFKLLYNPEENIELYEKYLPYAISLNAEKNWSTKFSSVFQKMKDHKLYWTNSPIFMLNNINFSYNLTNILNKSISKNFISNLTAPTSTSGFAGRGRSGESGGGSIGSW